MEFIKRRLSLIIAVLFAGVSSLGMFHYLQNRESVSVAQPIQAVAAPAQTTAVVVAALPLTVGHKITEEDLALQKWPSHIVTEKHFQTPQQLVGRILRSDVIAEEPMTGAKLLPEGENISSLIPADMRGVTVAIRRSETLLNVLQKGSFVDVLAVLDGQLNEHEVMTGQETKTLAYGAKVLSVYDPSTETRVSRDMEVVLLVKTHSAGKIVAAMNNGIIELIVRNKRQPVLEIS